MEHQVIYAVFAPHDRARPEYRRMERFPTIEDAARALRERIARNTTSTYYLTDGNGRTRPTHRFRRATRTAYMLVWVRPLGVGAPGRDDRHDEVWSLGADHALRRRRPIR